MEKCLSNVLMFSLNCICECLCVVALELSLLKQGIKVREGELGGVKEESGARGESDNT